MNKKMCSNCKQIKTIDYFYKDKSRFDGREYNCKVCANILASQQRERNRTTVRNRDKRYYKKHKKEISERRIEYYKENKHKFRARWQVKRALRNGTLIKPNRCSNCRLLGKIEAHHDDYEKSLEIKWLCKLCHNRLDFNKNLPHQ